MSMIFADVFTNSVEDFNQAKHLTTTAVTSVSYLYPIKVGARRDRRNTSTTLRQ